jgi:Spy/CpxP family protein refolding chaperone
MTLRRMSLFALVLAATATARAQQPGTFIAGAPASQEPRPNDPLMSNLFPPELIMQNQDAIKLTDDQRQYIITEIQRVQTIATGVQWRLQAAMERLGVAVHADKPEEALVLAQLDSVLALERDMKRAQIGLLVRLKGHLTSDQQAALRQRMPPHDD